MADQVTVDNGALTDYDVSTDDAGAAGHVQRVKLAYSADGSATHVAADADGLLVNLGANNDVTVTGQVSQAPSTLGTAGPTTLDLDGENMVIACSGYATVAIQAITNDLNADANLILAGSVDGGTTYGSVDGGFNTYYFANQWRADEFTETDVLIVPCAGMTHVRLYLNNRSAGSIVLQARMHAGVAPTQYVAATLIDGTSTNAELYKWEDFPSSNGHPGFPMLAVQKATPANTAGTDGDYEFLQVSAGRLWTSTTVTGTVAVTQSGTWDEVGINDSGNSITVDNGGTFATQTVVGGLTQGVVDETGASAVDAAAVGGGTPHDSVDSGNPIKMGWKAANALPTAVANADRVNGISDLFGRQLVGHIDPAMQVHKSFNATTTQTGATIWDPTAGKKIAVTSIVIGTYGTTAGRVIVWFGANGDTTYSAGTDQLVLAFSTAPSTTSKPGLVFTPTVPVFCVTADHELHITTDANVSIDLACEGYEW